MSKKILIPVSNSGVTRNILRSDVLKHIRASGNSIVLVVPRDKYESYRNEFESENIRVYQIPDKTPSFPERMLSFLSRNAHGTETIRMWQKMELEWNHRRMMYVIKRMLWLVFGVSKFFHRLLRFAYAHLSPRRGVIDFLAETNPDLVFIPDAFGDVDIPFWQAAEKSGIKTTVMVRSWDNLSNHGLLRMAPETLIVHNPFLKRLAVELHHIPEQNITIVGLPHYDWYARQNLLLSREGFFKKMGLDPSKKLILFAGIGDYLAPHDWEVARILDKAIEEKKISSPVQVIFRPHPAFTVANRGKLQSMKHIIFDDYVTRPGYDAGKGEMGEEEMAHLVNSLKHADCVVTTASTITLDAVAFGRPVICIAFDGESREPYWNSVLRYYRDFTHYKLLTQTGGFRVAYNQNELIAQINEYLRNPSLDEEGRKKIFDDFIWKLDGKSAQRIADVIVKT